jgi:hypothetical protein
MPPETMQEIRPVKRAEPDQDDGSKQPSLFERIYADIKQDKDKPTEDLKATAATPGVETKDGLVTAVNYPDGSSRKFAYDENKQLNKIDDKGELWQKQAGGWWNGREYLTGSRAVAADGTYAYRFEYGDNISVISPKDEWTKLSLREINKLHAEVAQHEKWEQSQSYLERGIDYLTDKFTGEKESFEKAKQLDAAATEAVKRFDLAKIRELTAQIPTVLEDDHQALLRQSRVNNYGSTAIVMGSVFLPKAGVAAASWALDTANPNAPAGRQAVQFFVGASSGLITHGMFAKMNAMTVEPTHGMMAKLFAKQFFTAAIPKWLITDGYTPKALDKLTPQAQK